MSFFSKCTENNLDISNSVSESKECLNTIMSQPKEGANSMINKYKEGLNTSISEDCLIGVTSRSKMEDKMMYNVKGDENIQKVVNLTPEDFVKESKSSGQVLIDGIQMMYESIDYVLLEFVKGQRDGKPTDYIQIYKIDDEYNVRAVVEYADEYSDHTNYLELKTEKFYTGTDDLRSTKNFLELSKLLREFFNVGIVPDVFELFLKINGNRVSTNKSYSVEELVEFIMKHSDKYYEEML